MELHNNTATLLVETRDAWRDWLSKNHSTKSSIWLIIYHKNSKKKSIYYDEAVEEALCFGWIDSIAHKRDHESKYQYFTPRKAKSNWSKANKQRVDKMLAQGRMTESGQAMIDLAKRTGTWEALEKVQQSILPIDLQIALDQNTIAKGYFEAFPPSSKRIILEWLLNAKKEEIRQKRIAEIIALAAVNKRANHYRQ